MALDESLTEEEGIWLDRLGTPGHMAMARRLIPADIKAALAEKWMIEIDKKGRVSLTSFGERLIVKRSTEK